MSLMILGILNPKLGLLLWHNRDIAPIGAISRVVFSKVLAIPVLDHHPI